MTTTWDYTTLAQTYSLRPRYAPEAVDRIVGLSTSSGSLGRSPRAADIGAGTGHLTIDLLARGCEVDAVEPNEAMSRIGRERTRDEPGVRWFAGTAEHNELPSDLYDLVSFGSSFNTTDRPRALAEAARLTHRTGHLACLWNYRRLDDPLQAEIETLIRRRVPGYMYGVRREDQQAVIERSGLFGPVVKIEHPVLHRIAAADWIEAWRSHGTLARQAGASFDDVVDAIGALVRARSGDVIEVPYTTVGWAAPRRSGNGRV